MILIIIFWLLMGIIFYTYFGYTLILLFLAFIKNIFKNHSSLPETINYEPEVSLIIPSYNEEQFINNKISNTLAQEYPVDKLKIIWITDGSTDGTTALLQGHPEFTIMHQQERRGKAHAMNRAMTMVKTPIVVFTDANSMLNRQAVREIIKMFADNRTGCVTGEKKIAGLNLQKAVDAGEGLYWRYESLIKRLESETGSVVGAVGEIFAIRSGLYEELSEDTLLDDFTVSLQIIRKGYSIKYAPLAWGTETASLSVSEEIKRKVRIATGGLQSLTRMAGLLNPLKFGLLSFKYISHKVLRWTLVPVSFPLLFLLNILILFSPAKSSLYAVLLIFQCIFYIVAFLGKLFENVKTRIGIFFAPYYLFIMNYAVLRGCFRFFSGDYSVNWQKVKRS